MEKYGIVRQATNENILWRMYFVCWITEATDTYPEYAILTAFSQQQWLGESASVLRLVLCVLLQCMDASQLNINCYVPGIERKITPLRYHKTQ